MFELAPAAEAGVNLAMVNYHFGTKEKMLEELIAHNFPRTREQLEALAQSPLDPFEKLMRTVDIYAEKFFDGYDFHCVIMRELSLSQRPELVQRITSHLAHSLGIVRGFILEGQHTGIFRPVDVELTLATVFGSFSALISQGSLMCVLMDEDCKDNIYSDKSRVRFKNHLKELLRAHLMTERG